MSVILFPCVFKPPVSLYQHVQIHVSDSIHVRQTICQSVYPCIFQYPSMYVTTVCQPLSMCFKPYVNLHQTNGTCDHRPYTYITMCARSIGMYNYCQAPPTWQGLTGVMIFTCRGSKARFWIYLVLPVGMIKCLGLKKLWTLIYIYFFYMFILYYMIKYIFFSLLQNIAILVQLL